MSLFVALFIADLTGPYRPDKFSVDTLQHQFRYSYAYGYLMFAVILWWLCARRVLERHGLREPPQRTAGPLHAALVVAGCVLGGLTVAVTANPWLNPRFHSSDVALTSHGSSIFGQWPTYLFLAMSLVVAWRILRLQQQSAPVARRSASRRFLTPQLTLAISLTALFIAIEWPKFLAAYWQSDVAESIGIYVLLALGLNVVVGFAGLLDLGYVAFYAVGAYTARLLHRRAAGPSRRSCSPLFWVIPLGIGAAMLAGVLLGTADAAPPRRLPRDRDARVRGDHRRDAQQLARTSRTARAARRRSRHFTVHLFGTSTTCGATPTPAVLLPAPRFIIVAILVFSSLEQLARRAARGRPSARTRSPRARSASTLSSTR